MDNKLLEPTENQRPSTPQLSQDEPATSATDDRKQHDTTEEETTATVEVTSEPLSSDKSEPVEQAVTSDTTNAPDTNTPADTTKAIKTDLPPLPDEPAPSTQDDGWSCQWDPHHQAWYFLNRFTNVTQWDNPRLQPTTAAHAPAPALPSEPVPTSTSSAQASGQPTSGGYNPAIHGDYDPKAWYARQYTQPDDHNDLTEPTVASLGTDQDLTPATAFNRATGQLQQPGAGPERYTDDAKSRRQLNAFFDVDAAANANDGRSLKAERSLKKPTKAEVKQFKEKRKARKEEKRRAWLRD